MKEMKAYTIPFVGLKIGQHKYDFDLDKKFFEHFEYDEFHQAALKLTVVLVKKSNMLEIELMFDGTVNVSCDRTNEPFEYDEFHQAALKLTVILVKKSNMLEIELMFDGSVNVSCDRTNEPFDLPLAGSYHFVVKFGQERDDMQDELLILPHGAYQVNIQQQIYESIVLALPSKKIHPGIAEGTLKSEVLEQLEALKPQGEQQNNLEDVDPRWDDLKKLLTDK